MISFGLAMSDGVRRQKFRRFYDSTLRKAREAVTRTLMTAPCGKPAKRAQGRYDSTPREAREAVTRTLMTAPCGKPAKRAARG